jgi:hypothetical protein
MRPNELLYAIQDIITEECQCEGAWAQHPQDMTDLELIRVAMRINVLLAKTVEERIQCSKA